MPGKIALVLGFCATLGSVAHAATYVGSLTGVVTAGTLTYYRTFEPPYTASFANIPISIAFSANVRSNVLSPVSHILFPQYVINKISVSIPTFNNPGFPYNSVQSNDPDLTPSSHATFMGNLRKGVFDVHQDYNVGSSQQQSVHFFYEQSTTDDGQIVGGGSASLSTQFGSYRLLFTLTDGRVLRPALQDVTARSAAPEPEIWALLFVGFGVIGVAQRTKRRIVCETSFRELRQAHIGY